MNEKEDLGMFVLFPSEFLEQMTARQAVICGIIIGMSKKSGFAYPSNQTMANILNITTITLQREFAILEQNGFIQREFIRNEKNEIVMRKIYPIIKNDSREVSKLKGGVISNLQPPPYQICNSNKDNINKDKTYNKKTNFEVVWEMYGRKGVKQTAMNQFMKLRDDEIVLLTNQIPKYIENHAKAMKMEFLPHMSTYLKQKRFNDAMPYEETKTTPTIQSTTYKKLKIENYHVD